MTDQNIDNRLLIKQGTGTRDSDEDSLFVSVPFDRYVITLKLSPIGEFREVIEVKMNKGFLSHAQKLQSLRSSGFHDVEQFYRGTDD